MCHWLVQFCLPGGLFKLYKVEVTSLNGWVFLCKLTECLHTPTLADTQTGTAACHVPVSLDVSSLCLVWDVGTGQCHVTYFLAVGLQEWLHLTALQQPYALSHAAGPYSR